MPISNTGLSSFRLSTSASTPRTSSNESFNEKFRDSLRHSTGSVSNIVKNSAGMVPGGAVLSSAVSSLANQASIGQGHLPTGADGTLNSMDTFQNQMQDRQEKILQTQLKVGEVTTEYSAISNIVRTKTETEKQMSSNIK